MADSTQTLSADRSGLVAAGLLVFGLSGLIIGGGLVLGGWTGWFLAFLGLLSGLTGAWRLSDLPFAWSMRAEAGLIEVRALSWRGETTERRPAEALNAVVRFGPLVMEHIGLRFGEEIVIAAQSARLPGRKPRLAHWRAFADAQSVAFIDQIDVIGVTEAPGR